MKKQRFEQDDEFYSSALTFRQVDDFFIAIDPDLPNLLRVGKHGKQILDLCKEGGSYRYGDFLFRASKETGLPREEIEQFLEALHKSKFIRKSPLSAPKKNVSPEKLETLFLELTQSCNLTCQHCYYSAGSSGINELERGGFLSILGQFYRLGGESLSLTGGEPFLRREVLFDVIREASENGLSVQVETNATLLTEKDVEMLKKYDVSTAVSLDGATPETHNGIRGEGTFQKTLHSLQLLDANDVNVSITFTLMKPNKDEITSLFSLLQDFNINKVQLNQLISEGRAATNQQTIGMSPKETVQTLKRAYHVSKDFDIDLVMFEGLLDNFREQSISCNAGVSVLDISATGAVYPCRPSQGIAFFKAGNIQNSDLETLWKDSSTLKKVRNYTLFDISECKHCELKYFCGGRCPVANYRANQSIDEKSDCQIYRELTWHKLIEIARNM